MRVWVGWVFLIALHGLAEGNTQKKPIRAWSRRDENMLLRDPVKMINPVIAACNLSTPLETTLEGALEHMVTDNEQLEIFSVKLAKEREELAMAKHKLTEEKNELIQKRDDLNHKMYSLAQLQGKLSEERNQLNEEKNALASKRLELCKKYHKLPKMQARSAKKLNERPETQTGSANEQNSENADQNADDDSYYWSYNSKKFWELLPVKPKQKEEEEEDLQAQSRQHNISPSNTKPSNQRPPFKLPAVQPPPNQEVSAAENARFQNCLNRVLSSLNKGKLLLWKVENIFLDVGSDNEILSVPIKLVKLVYSAAKNILADLLYSSLKLAKFLLYDIYHNVAKMLYRAVRNMIHLLTKLTNWTVDSAIGHAKPLPTVNGFGPCGGQWPCQRTIDCKSGCHHSLVEKNKNEIVIM